MKAAHGHPFRKIPLGEECPYQLPRPKANILFNVTGFTMDEVRAVREKARAGSTPGPSGTSFKIYKNCPQLLKRLSKLLRTLWQKRQEPKVWTHAEGRFVPKGQNSAGLEEFQEISLLDVEGKIFWSIVAKRLISNLLSNEYQRWSPRVLWMPRAYIGDQPDNQGSEE